MKIIIFQVILILEFAGFYDYFKDKKEIMMRFIRFSGHDCLTEIPYINELSVKKPREIQNFNFKYFMSFK